VAQNYLSSELKKAPSGAFFHCWAKL